MNTRFSKSIVSVLVIAALALAIVPLAGAQEGPPQVGLRPDAPPYALHGPYWVGTTAMEAETEFHPTKIQLWYPAKNVTKSEESLTYFAGPAGQQFPVMGRAILDAELDPSGGPYPLAIFVHGLSGGPLGSAYLCEHLASHGFIVMAIAYADSSDLSAPSDPALALYTRPKDVSWQIDYAEQLNSDATGMWQGMFNLEQIGMVGHSYGGYTALVAGGALMDLTGSTSWCLQYPQLQLPAEIGGGTLQSRFCNRAEQLAELAGLESVPEGLWPSWSDPRIDALVVLAPWMPFFGSESTTTLDIPTMLMFGAMDRIVDTERELYRLYAYDYLGSTTKSLVVFEQAGHMVYSTDCTSMPVFNNPAMSWVCSDPIWDMDRAHDLTDHFVTAFFFAELHDDEDAAAALAPDAVQFPGITYETTVF